MKFVSTVATLSIAVSGVGAFSVPSQQQRGSTVALQAQRESNNWATSNVAAAMIGVVTAAVVSTSPLAPNQSPSPMVVHAETMSLDFSLPSYDPSSKTTGFISPEDAGLNIGVGGREQELQRQALEKAEAARKERQAAKFAERKAQEQEAQRREAEKKARMGERMQTLFN